MSIITYREPQLENPDMICSWPGIGNIGLIAVDTLRGQLKARELGQIEPWDYFEPHKVFIQNGMLEELWFPRSRFFYHERGDKDLLFFTGEEQPGGGGKVYAHGEKAFRMAESIVEVALKHGCRRIYTSGACVSMTHHQVKPRVVAVTSSEKLNRELKRYPNLVTMSELGEAGGEGVITGMNGLMLAVAKKKGLEAVCLMGEIPDWLARVPFPYTKASKSVLEVFGSIFGIDTRPGLLDRQSAEVDRVIESFYEKFPEEVKEIYDQRKTEAKPVPISEKEAEWMKENLDEFLKSLTDEQEKGDDNGDRPI